MKRSLALLTKLVLLVSLVLASMPAGATETVCVMGGGKVVRPVAKCGMPCCAEKRLAKPVPEKRSCCLPEKPAALVKRGSKADPCSLAGMSCRCETRLVAAPSSNIATVDAKGSVVAEQPALLPRPLEIWTSAALEIQEPGIVGIDSGPPPKREHSPVQPRAPPVVF